MSAFDPDLNPLLHRISASPEGAEDIKALYERHGIDPSKGPDELASKIRLDGGNSFANKYRGKGPPYKEVVKDVASKLKVKVPDTASVEKIEGQILVSIAKKWDNLSEEEREEVIEKTEETDPGKGEAFKNAFLGGGVGMFAFLNVLFGIWIFIGIAGPAYRKTIPTVITIAILRLDYLGGSNET